MENTKAPRVIGHRGAAGYAPENTLASVRYAANLGVKWVEVDVKITGDGAPGRAVVRIGELTAMSPDVLQRRRPGSGFARSIARESREVVASIREGLNVHLPIGHLDGVEHNPAIHESRPRHRHSNLIRNEEGTGIGRHPFDDQTLDHEAAPPEMSGQAADVHGPTHEL